MIIVLVVVIVVLLLVLGTGTAVMVRRREREVHGEVHGELAEHDAETRLAPPPGTPAEEPLLPSPLVVATADLEAPVAPARPARLKQAMSRARQTFAGPLGSLRRRGRVDEESFEELETALLLADVGLTTTNALLAGVRAKVEAKHIEADPESLIQALREEILALFEGDDASLSSDGPPPRVWLFVGVNGVGKTTTIGKIANKVQAAGQKVVLAAGDTFRAAAADQLALWAERSGTSIIRGADGADPSSVVFDAVEHAAARGADLVLADSAGRLHTKTNLMEELKKVRRVADRPPGHVSEVLLVLDATTGQNGLAQARQFAEAVGVTGIILTKLDGTAKGGIVLAVRAELGLPIKLVGLGEGLEDLVDFDPAEFADALLGID